jgi:hypothetical protein
MMVFIVVVRRLRGESCSNLRVFGVLTAQQPVLFLCLQAGHSQLPTRPFEQEIVEAKHGLLDRVSQSRTF